MAVLLPPQVHGAPSRSCSRLDGLIISGGPDVDPERYGAEPHPRTHSWRPERDAWELALLDAAEAAGTPDPGHLPRHAAHGRTRRRRRSSSTFPMSSATTSTRPAADAFGWVSITTQPDSLVRELVGDRLQVNCHHHQAVATHPGFEVTARAADGTVEAIEDPERTVLAGRAVAPRVRRRPRPVPRARPSRVPQFASVASGGIVLGEGADRPGRGVSGLEPYGDASAPEPHTQPGP